MSLGRRAVLSLLCGLAALLVAAPTANANHHFISVSEVYPGATGTEGNEFVELQMYADGQNVFAGNTVRIDVYEPGGSTVLAQNLMTNPGSGANQRTVLIGTVTADSQFGLISDFVLGGSNVINPAGGAVCFRSTAFGNIDCVSWGSFTNVFSLPVGTAEAAIPNASSIRRSLTPGCPTLLEAGDDTNDSATDFTSASPSPRPNSVTPTEGPCTTPPPTGGGGSTTPPVTTPAPVKKKKCKTAKKRSAAAGAKCKKRK